MDRRWRWTIRGVLVMVFGTTLLMAYLVVCLFGYGCGWGLPPWFLAGFDYAVDETPLRTPILSAAELFGLRDNHKLLSMIRRMRARLREQPVSVPDGSDGMYWCYHTDPELDEYLWRENDEIWQFLGLATRAKPSRPCLNPPPLDADLPKTWEELALKLIPGKAERRCLE